MEENNQKLRKCAKVVKYVSWGLAGTFALLGLIYFIMCNDAATLAIPWYKGGLTFLFGYIIERVLITLADIEENTRQSKMRQRQIVLCMIVAGLLTACAKEEPPQPHASNQAESLTTTTLDWGTPQQGTFEM